MIQSVLRGLRPAKSDVRAEGSPAQQALLDDLAVELQRLRALDLRCSRVIHVRPGSSVHAALRFAHSAIGDVFSALDRCDALGGSLEFRYTADRGAELVYVDPPARVIDLAEARARLRVAR